MAVSDHVDFSTFMEGVKRRNAGQPEFVQAVQEVSEDIFDFIADKEEYHAQQILRRIAEPEDIANTVLFFSSAAASDITGQTLSVNGGFRMY